MMGADPAEGNGLSSEFDIVDKLRFSESPVISMIVKDGDVVGGGEAFEGMLGCKGLLGVRRGLMPDEGEVAEGVHEDGGDAIAVDGELRGFHLSNEPRCGRLQLVHVDALSRRSGRF